MNNRPILVLLPGLDGTGRLIKFFAETLPVGQRWKVIAYPNDKTMPLSALEKFVRAKLPREPFLLIAESFGGLIAARLAADPSPGMKGLVLSASFATFPMNRAWAPLQFVLRPSLFKGRPPRVLTQLLLAGTIASPAMKEFLEDVIHSVNPAILLARLKIVLETDTLSLLKKSTLPLLYLRATRDRLVRERSLQEILQARPDAVWKEIDAPHFLLQFAPDAAWREISAFASHLEKGSKPTSRPRRILIATATAGGGHLQAAAAIEEAWKIFRPQDELKRVDILEFTPTLYRKAYAEGYVRIAERTPEIYAHAFRKTDDVAFIKRMKNVRRLGARLVANKFVRLVDDWKPDVVICPHFLPMETLGSVRGRAPHHQPKIVTVVTDFEAHALWIEPCVDFYCVAMEETKARLVARGVPAQRVAVTGIPISQRFSKKFDRELLRRKFSLNAKKPTLLVLGGGMGMGPLEETMKSLDQADAQLQLIVVAGRNEALQRALESRRYRQRVRVIGFAQNMEELMTVSDLIVTKPGGLTSSEALALGKPLLIVRPLPGQEEANSDFMLERGAAAKVNRQEDLAYRVASLLASGKLPTMSRAAKRLGRPAAAMNVCSAVWAEVLKGRAR